MDQDLYRRSLETNIKSSVNGSASNLLDSAGQSFRTSFSGQSATIQGMHNMHGSYNFPNMPGTLASRNSTAGNIGPGGVQQPSGNLSTGRFTSSNLQVALSQLSHGSSHGHSGVPSRGINVLGNPGFSSNANGVAASIPGILPTSAGIGNQNSVQGLGVSPILGNGGSRMTNAMGNMVVGGNMGRSIGSGGGLSVHGLSSRLTANNVSESLGVQGQNRLMGGLLPQGSSQLMSMLGNSYSSGGGPLSQSHVQAMNSLSSMGMLNGMNSNESTPFDINLDFPQLTSRPSSAGGPQGQLGSLRKQIPSIIQQNQEFSIQNEDFPALPGFKGSNADFSLGLHHKDQVHENTASMMQPQHFSMGRSAGFNLGETYTSNRPQQQHANSVGSNGISFSSVNNQDLLHFHGSDIFPSSQSTYHSQTSGPPGLGSRSLISPNTVSGMGSCDQLIQQYQPHQNQSQFRSQQMYNLNQSFREPTVKSTLQASQPAPDSYGLLGLLSVIRTSDPDLASIALGIDLLTLGLNLNLSEDIHKTFGSPWSDKPATGDPEFVVPQCYYGKQPPALHQGYFSKFTEDTLFYVFYSMPKDEAQLYAANELYNRGWFYHRELFRWFIRVPNVELLVKTDTYERGSYHFLDPNTFQIMHKDNFVVHYEMVEKRPTVPQH